METQNLQKLKRIGELFKEIRKDNNLVNQNLERYVELVAELKVLLKDEEVESLTARIKEILVIVDENNGFTIEGVFKNPYMEALTSPTNEIAKQFHADANKLVIVVNESHHDGSAEFATFPEHCKAGTTEAEYAEILKWILDIYPVFEKNTTMAAFAPGYLDFLTVFANLQRVVFAGGVTDICYLEAALSTRKYFDQNDYQDIEILAVKELADTYDAPWHNRMEWNEMAFRFMEQAGVKLAKSYEGGENYGK